MMDSLKQGLAKGIWSLGKQQTYNEIVEYLDSKWLPVDVHVQERMKKLDKALGHPSSKLPVIFVTGTNGKSLTIYFTARLLHNEGLKVGTYYAPHVLNYNERLAFNGEYISNKQFTELANEVINAAESIGGQYRSAELLAMMSLVYFVQQKADVIIMEVSEGAHDPALVCSSKISTITRVTPSDVAQQGADLESQVKELKALIHKDSYIVCGDQSKHHLNILQDLTHEAGAHWAMPIRKLAALPYPFEQLHGRCAALAERTAQLCVEKCLVTNTTLGSDSILMRQKGVRGRPTLEEKRKAELYPKKTIDQFWKETINELPSRFQLLDKEKPTILLDTAHNIDAFKNLLLGIRLLHYQRPLKGLTIVAAAAKNTLHSEEFLKLLRYFFKKTAGQIYLCPLEQPLAGVNEDESWDVEQIANDIKTMKVKARACKNFEEAFEAAKKSVDERNGLVVITGSQSIINTYWKHKGIKKF